MGTYLFKWTGEEHHANSVKVTGTFDNWSKSTDLSFTDGAYQKLVDIPNPNEKVLYKYIVDGTWTTDHTRPIENDEHGIPNNVLMPDEITKKDTSASDAPSSTTDAAKDASTAAAPTSTTDAAKDASTSDASPSAGTVGGIAAGAGALGAGGVAAAVLPSMSSHSSTVPLAGAQPLEKDVAAGGSTYGVNPIPATSGIGNPVTLAPGEKVPDPSTLTNNTTTSTVKTDAASYEKSDALPASAAPAQAVSEDKPTSATVIPESGVPAEKTATDDVPTNFVQSTGPGATTAALAGNVPLEPRGTPTVVDDKTSSGLSTGEKAAIGGAAGAVGVGGAAALASHTDSSSAVKPTVDGTATPQLVDDNTAPAINYANNAPPPEEAPSTAVPSTDIPPKVPGPAHRQPIPTTTNDLPSAPSSTQQGGLAQSTKDFVGGGSTSKAAAASAATPAKDATASTSHDVSPMEPTSTSTPSAAAATSGSPMGAITSTPTKPAASDAPAAGTKDANLALGPAPPGGVAATAGTPIRKGKTGEASSPAPAAAESSSASPVTSSAKKEKRKSGFFTKFKQAFKP